MGMKSPYNRKAETVIIFTAETLMKKTLLTMQVLISAAEMANTSFGVLLHYKLWFFLVTGLWLLSDILRALSKIHQQPYLSLHDCTALWITRLKKIYLSGSTLWILPVVPQRVVIPGHPWTCFLQIQKNSYFTNSQNKNVTILSSLSSIILSHGF